jgi:hypothetical protein
MGSEKSRVCPAFFVSGVASISCNPARVASRADGSVSNVGVVDAMPRPEVAAMMHEFAASLTVKPGTGQTLRYGWMPVMMDDRRYGTTTRH